MWHRPALWIANAVIAFTATSSHSMVSSPADGRMELVARMRIARSAGTATSIGGNRVLIAGGMTAGGGALREYEVFDASTNRIVASGEMGQARSGHTATRLPDGRVLVLGGYNGSYLSSAAMFDPRSLRFTNAGSMSAGRSGHTATLLRDGTVLITGGVGDGWSFLSSAEVYDPRSGRFTSVRPMSAARESHTASLLSDGRVLISGGHRDRREHIVVYASTEIYDPALHRFRSGPEMTSARHKHDAVSLAGGGVLVVGGSDPRDRTLFTSAEVYDPTTVRWRAVSSMRVGRYKLRDTSLRLNDGRVLVSGSGRYAEIFDARTNSFTRVAGDLGDSYAFASSAMLGDGRVVVLGGYDDDGRNIDGIWVFRQ
jgi:hypothetical protein